MKRILDFIEDEYKNDPIVFSWLNAKRRGQWTDEEALLYLVKSLISNKNMAIKAVDKLRNKGKILEFRRPQ